MKRLTIVVLFLFVALVSGACGPSATPAPSRDAPPASQSAYEANHAPGAQPNAPGKSADASSNAASADRLIIKTASLSLTVKDAEAALDTVRNMTTALGGFISNSQATRVDKDRVRVSVTVRVPAEKFDEALRQIKQASVRVNSERLGGQDVTEEYIDLGARLRNLEATEKELLALMTTVRERSNKAEEILAVQRELNNVRQQIEQLKGRMQYLERSVALATITLDLIPEALEGPVTTANWDPLLVARDALRTLANLLQGLANLGIYLLILGVPLLLIAGVPLVLLLRWLARRPRGTTRAAS